MQATSNVIDQEKMAVILQEVVGTQYGDRYYPAISGVARSINYYPINDELAEEGTVSLALGLGKYIVDGGLTLRVCPYHPTQVLQTSEMEIALRETQTRFYALDLKNLGQNFSLDDGFNLLKLHVKDAESRRSLELHRFYLRSVRHGDTRRYLSRRPQADNLCQHPSARCLPAGPYPAIGTEIRSG